MGNFSEIVHSIIQSVWNEGASKEEVRQDVSHWRGVGRWADDKKWLGIGKKSLKNIEKLWRFLGRPKASLAGLTIMEWGPGGGSNAVGLKNIALRYYGVDISEKNLNEAARQCVQEVECSDYFKPILLLGPPSQVLKRIPSEVDLFLSTAVFQHFPSKEYAIEVLETVFNALKTNGVAIIQIRFDNDNLMFQQKTKIQEYNKNFITYTSFKVDDFWNTCISVGLTPLYISDMNSKINYATIHLVKKNSDKNSR